MNRLMIFALGIVATLAAAALWQGPAGAGERMAWRGEQLARRTLDHYEMTGVQARFERGPLTRRLLLSGTADEFQRGELVRIMPGIPGVAEARWRDAASRTLVLPLMIEAMLLALAGFSLGLLIAYLFELRRRAKRWDRI